MSADACGRPDLHWFPGCGATHPGSHLQNELTAPRGHLNAVLWRVVAMTADGRYLEGYYSLLDPEPRVSFVSRADGHERLVFSFVVGRREGEAIEPGPVRQRPGPDFPPGLWTALGERILGRSAEPACLLPC